MREREHLADLARGDLVDVDAAVPVERGDPAILLEPVGVGRDLDEADRLEAGREPGLRLEPAVEIAGVLAHLGRGLRGRAEGDHQPGRVPRGARREPVALEEHDVVPARVSQVIGDRGADDAAADDDHACARRQDRFGHVAQPTQAARRPTRAPRGHYPHPEPARAPRPRGSGAARQRRRSAG